MCKGSEENRTFKELQEIHNVEARIRNEGGEGPNHETEGEAGYSAKTLRLSLDLGHRKPLKVFLNKDYVLYVKEGFLPHTPTEGRETGLEAAA